MPRESGTRGQPHRLHHRQPEREERRKRGPSVDPHGFDAGKLIKARNGIFLSICKVCCCTRSFIPLVFWIATVASGCSPRCSANFLFSQNCSPIAPMRDQFSIRRSQSLAQPRNRNRQTLRSCQRVRAVTQALDRRTYDRLVEPLPPTGQGLGEPQSQRSRLPQTRFHPPHVTKAVQSLIKSPDGL